MTQEKVVRAGETASVSGSTVFVRVDTSPENSGKRWLRRIVLSLLLVSIILNLWFILDPLSYSPPGIPEQHFSGDSGAKDRIAIINFEGTISPPFTERWLKQIKRATEDETIKGVVMVIDSPGGFVADSHQLLRKIQELSKAKPVYVAMKRIAASGGYYISMGIGEQGVRIALGIQAEFRAIGAEGDGDRRHHAVRDGKLAEQVVPSCAVLAPTAAPDAVDTGNLVRQALRHRHFHRRLAVHRPFLAQIGKFRVDFGCHRAGTRTLLGVRRPATPVQQLFGNVFTDGQRLPDGRLVVQQGRHFQRGGIGSELLRRVATVQRDVDLFEGDAERLEEQPWPHGPGGVVLVAYYQFDLTHLQSSAVMAASG